MLIVFRNGAFEFKRFKYKLDVGPRLIICKAILDTKSYR